jgi:hypothetical protein
MWPPEIRTFPAAVTMSSFRPIPLFFIVKEGFWSLFLGLACSLRYLVHGHLKASGRMSFQAISEAQARYRYLNRFSDIKLSMNQIKRPAKERIRQWLRDRQINPGPLPTMERIKSDLGWTSGRSRKAFRETVSRKPF